MNGMVRAFRHGRLVTREEARQLSISWWNEMNRYVKTRSDAEKRSVQLYVHEYLSRLSKRASKV